MAMSLNGKIAGVDGNEDFLSHKNWETFLDLAKECGCFIVGRKTYEIVQGWKGYNFNDVEAKLKIIVSNNNDLKLKAPFILAHSPKDAIKKVEEIKIDTVILTGGSTMNSAFIKENLIDEIILNIEPVVLGHGIALFSDSDFEKRLELLETVKLDKDILQVKYKVK